MGGGDYLSLAIARLDHQMDVFDGYAAKVGTILSVALAEAGFLLALLTIRSGDLGTFTSCVDWALVVFGVLAVLALVFTLWQGRLVLRVRALRTYAEPEKVRPHRHSPDVTWKLADTLESAYTGNRAAADEQAGLLKSAEKGLLLLTVFTAITSGLLAFYPAFANL